MLVLSRQRDETIMIGDEIEITIVDIRGDKVRLGINAPRQVQVHRKEVYEAIQRENAAAATGVQVDDVSAAEQHLRSHPPPPPEVTPARPASIHKPPPEAPPGNHRGAKAS